MRAKKVKSIRAQTHIMHIRAKTAKPIRTHTHTNISKVHQSEIHTHPYTCTYFNTYTYAYVCLCSMLKHRLARIHDEHVKKAHFRRIQAHTKS